MKSVYTIYICPKCGDHYIFAGSCDCDPLSRLVARRVVPISTLEEYRDKYTAKSSPVPKWFIEHFVMDFLRFIGVRQEIPKELRLPPE